MKKLYILISLSFIFFLLAGCQSKTYEVSFEMNGATTEQIRSQKISSGRQALKPADPLKDGFIFEYWYEQDSDVAWDFETNPINSSITLVAKWREIETNLPNGPKEPTETEEPTIPKEPSEPGKPEEPTVPEEPLDPDQIYIDGTTTLYGPELWAIKDDFETTNIELDAEHLKVIDADELAVYQSKPISITSYQSLVMSWNVLDLDKEQLNFLVSIGKDNQFSRFFIMGSWKDGNNRSFSNQEDDFGKVNVDILTNKDLNNDLIIIKITINTFESDSAKIKNVSFTTKKADNLVYDESLLVEKKIAVTPISQLDIPIIGNLICSPTSLTMVLNYYGNDLVATDVAKKVQDQNNNIYGNWTLNASYAGGFGLDSRVEYISDFQQVIDYIKEDIPVIMSIRSSSMDDLTGSIMGYPSGHLVVLIGFKLIDGKWYGIFNDPAEYDATKVERFYEMSQVLNVFRNYTYILKTTKF